jgi:hypothetical protein
MAQNETIALALEAQPIPEDRECVRNLSEIVKGVQDYVQVIGDGSSQPGQIFPSAVVIAEKALATAEQAQKDVNNLAAKVPDRRTSGGLVSIPTGDSTLNISWSPALETTNYEVRVVFYGSATSAGDTFAYRVVDGTQSDSGVSIRLLNIPANTTKISWVVETLNS